MRQWTFVLREIRHLVIGDYRALFAVRGRQVFILHIRHGQRRYATKEDLASALDELRDHGFIR